jgi:hypothetical protein
MDFSISSLGDFHQLLIGHHNRNRKVASYCCWVEKRGTQGLAVKRDTGIGCCLSNNPSYWVMVKAPFRILNIMFALQAYNIADIALLNGCVPRHQIDISQNVVG